LTVLSYVLVVLKMLAVLIKLMVLYVISFVKGGGIRFGPSFKEL
jgi:hypothetical protein